MWFSEAFGNIDFGPATVARVCRLVSQFRWTFYSHAAGHSRPGSAPFGFAERGGHQRRILFLSDPLSLSFESFLGILYRPISWVIHPARLWVKASLRVERPPTSRARETGISLFIMLHFHRRVTHGILMFQSDRRRRPRRSRGSEEERGRKEGRRRSKERLGRQSWLGGQREFISVVACKRLHYSTW